MQLGNLESIISKLYQMNLTQLVRLSKLREKEGGLNSVKVAEYNTRIKDDDKYRKIKTEIDIITEDGKCVQVAKEQLYYLLSQKLDALSDESVDRIRRHGAGSMTPPKGVLDVEENEDKKFLESCQIKGDTSWIR